jgi:hypothetical protein
MVLCMNQISYFFFSFRHAARKNRRPKNVGVSNFRFRPKSNLSLRNLSPYRSGEPVVSRPSSVVRRPPSAVRRPVIPTLPSPPSSEICLRSVTSPAPSSGASVIRLPALPSSVVRRFRRPSSGDSNAAQSLRVLKFASGRPL